MVASVRRASPVCTTVPKAPWKTKPQEPGQWLESKARTVKAQAPQATWAGASSSSVWKVAPEVSSAGNLRHTSSRVRSVHQMSPP